MTTRIRIDKPIRAALLDALVARGLAPTTPAGTTILQPDADGAGGWLEVPDRDEVTAREVVAAHDAAALDAAEAARVADRTAARALVVQTAQSAVGVRFDQLTAAQVRALAAILFWGAGALTATGHVRPLAQWVLADDG